MPAVPSPVADAVHVLPAASSPVASAIPVLPALASPAPGPASEVAAATDRQPDRSVPQLSVPDAPPAPKPVVTPGYQIILDDADKGAVILQPPDGWRQSTETRRSYASSSVIAPVDGTVCTATFLADIPETGNYEVLLYWINSGASFRSSAVPVTVHSATGSVRLTTDQVRSGATFQSIGKFQFREGTRIPVVTVSTEGVPTGALMHVSVDALKLLRLAE